MLRLTERYDGAVVATVDKPQPGKSHRRLVAVIVVPEGTVLNAVPPTGTTFYEMVESYRVDDMQGMDLARDMAADFHDHLDPELCEHEVAMLGMLLERAILTGQIVIPVHHADNVTRPMELASVAPNGNAVHLNTMEFARHCDSHEAKPAAKDKGQGEA